MLNHYQLGKQRANNLLLLRYHYSRTCPGNAHPKFCSPRVRRIEPASSITAINPKLEWGRSVIADWAELNTCRTTLANRPLTPAICSLAGYRCGGRVSHLKSCPRSRGSKPVVFAFGARTFMATLFAISFKPRVIPTHRIPLCSCLLVGPAFVELLFLATNRLLKRLWFRQLFFDINP